MTLTIPQIRTRIKDGVYKAGDEELRLLAYGAIHRTTKDVPQVSVDERAAARTHISALEKECINQLRADLEEATGFTRYPLRDKVWTLVWDNGHANGLYEVVNEYEEITDVIYWEGE